MDAVPHYFTDNDVKFRDLLLEYMEEVLEKRLTSRDDETDLWNTLAEFTYNGLISPPAFIRCTSEVFRKYANHGIDLLAVLFDGLVSTVHDLSHPQPYPELLWIVIRENLLNELSTTPHIVDAINRICRIVDRNTVRAYLNYALINEAESKHADLVRSYYYTGHTVDSLKLVDQVVQFPKDDYGLLDYHYLNAMSFMFSPRSTSLTADERSWLKAYFTRGLAIGHSGIGESCRKALGQLGNLG